jgi:hypothetical protein
MEISDITVKYLVEYSRNARFLLKLFGKKVPYHAVN